MWGVEVFVFLSSIMHVGQTELVGFFFFSLCVDFRVFSPLVNGFAKFLFRHEKFFFFLNIFIYEGNVM